MIFLDLNLYKYKLGAMVNESNDIHSLFSGGDKKGHYKNCLSGKGVKDSNKVDLTQFIKTAKIAEERARINFEIESEDDAFWSFLIHQKLNRVHRFSSKSEFVKTISEFEGFSGIYDGKSFISSFVVVGSIDIDIEGTFING
jgi:hypothetical protein